jgi:hypothetical protein
MGYGTCITSESNRVQITTVHQTATHRDFANYLLKYLQNEFLGRPRHAQTGVQTALGATHTHRGSLNIMS